MTTWVLATYILLWILVLGLIALVLGLLREVGLNRQGSRIPKQRTFPSPSDDGPEVGSTLPTLSLDAINGYDKVELGQGDDGRATLLMFLSPMCEGCQLIVDALNAAAEREGHRLKTVVVMRTGESAATRAFLNVYPMRTAVIQDVDDVITHTFNVHNAPFGLVYASNRRLVRRGVVTRADDLAILLEGITTPEHMAVRVPHLAAANTVSIEAQDAFSRSE